MYVILSLLLTAAFAYAIHRYNHGPQMRALYGPKGFPDATGQLIYLTTLVAALFATIGTMLYLLSPMLIHARRDYTDPFGGQSHCVPVVEPNGYDGTWLAPWLTESTTAHQVGTTCWRDAN